MTTTNVTAIFNAVETVSRTMRSMERSIKEVRDSLQLLNASLISNTGVSQAQEMQVQDAGRAHSELAGEIGFVSAQLQGMNASMASSVASSGGLVGGMKAAENAIDEVGDETRETAAEMTILNAIMGETGLSAGALSVNIGAFNIALRNIATQIPILVTSIGTLLTVLSGLTVALLGVTTALAAMATGGAIFFVRELSKEFSEMEDTAQALQAIMLGLRDLFIQAMEPLADAEMAELFVDMVEGSARFVNRFAQFVDQTRDIWEAFGRVLGGTVMDRFDEMGNAFLDLWAVAGPILMDFLLFIINKWPDAMRFMADVMAELRIPLGEFAVAVQELFSAFIMLGSGLGQGILPVLTVLMDTLTAVANILNSLGSAGLTLLGAIAFLTIGMTRLVKIANKVATVGLATGGSLKAIATASGGLSGSLREATRRLQGFIITAAGLDKLEGDSALKQLADRFRGRQSFFFPIRENDFGRGSKRINELTGQFVKQQMTFAEKIQFAWGVAMLRVRRSISDAFGSLMAFSRSVVAVEKAMLASAAATLKDAFAKQINTFWTSSLGLATKGLIRRVQAATAWITAQTAAMFAGTAAAAVFAKAMAVLGVVANLALGGIPAILGAIVIATGLVVGILGNMDSVSARLGTTWDGLKSVMEGLFNVLLAVGVPSWNLMVDAMELIIGPLLSVHTLMERFLRFLGILGDDASLIGTVMEILGDAIWFVIDSVATLIEFVGDLINRLGHLVAIQENEDTLEGAKVSAADVRANVNRGAQAIRDRDVASRPDVNLNFEDKVEQNIDVTADPEEREQMRRIVKDALNEANSIARRRQGHGA